MVRSERSWARILVKRGLVAAILVLALAVYGLVTAGTQSLAFKPTASTSGGHSVSQALSPANGSINVAAQGPNHTLYFYWELEDSSGNYTGVWNGPLGIGAQGSTFSAPTILAQGNGGPSSPGYGNFDIAVQGPSNTGDLYWDISGTWYGPYQFAGPATVFGTPGMIEDSQGNLQITAEGPGNTLYAYWNTTGAFYGPLGIGGPNSTFSAPSMSRSGNNTHTRSRAATTTSRTTTSTTTGRPPTHSRGRRRSTSPTTTPRSTPRGPALQARSSRARTTRSTRPPTSSRST